MAFDYVRRLRDRVGHDLLLLASVAVLPRDDEGRVLLVRQSDSGQWATIGGAIEVDESPAEAAAREAREEAAVEVEVTGIIDCIGGPQFRMRYANGDEAAYVSIVYGARVTAGIPTPDGSEVLDVAWFSPDEFERLELNDFNKQLLRAVGLLEPPSG